MSILIGLLVAAATPPTPAKHAPVEDRLVCKRQIKDGQTGSTFKRWEKVCRKKSEWNAASNFMEDSIRRTRDRGAANLQEAAGGPNFCSTAAC